MIWPFGPRRPLPIDAAAWRGLQARLPYLRGFDDTDSTRMRELIAEFLSAKTFTGAHGLEPDDAMRLTIAAQACLPALRHGLRMYDDFVEIVVYPSAFAVRRKVVDDDGLVHEYDDVLAGEAMDGGPVVLSWDDVDGSADPAGANVVVHEFAHKMDLADGEADGCPPMPADRRADWRATLEAAYDAFTAALDTVESSIPSYIDPEDEAADDYFATLPLDPYAATDEAEFFAVAAEVFFVDPVRLAEAFPELYERFVGFFGQDPGARLGGRPPVRPPLPSPPSSK
ncbi:MAG TPA: M90 family metallopeptidase [Baekduia sp.]|nr:M90 family metallopeptidase [Baekduia sp.]